MSMLQQLPYFKTGDTFDLPVQCIDTATGAGIEITGDMVFTSSIQDAYGNNLADLVATPYADQQESPGFVMFSCLTSTANWPVGLGQMDIKLVKLGAIRHSQTIEFNIVRSITT